MKKIIFITYISLLFADYGGGYAGSGFRYGSNAREFSLAGALVADKTPGFYAFSNPALLQDPARLSDRATGLPWQSCQPARYRRDRVVPHDPDKQRWPAGNDRTEPAYLTAVKVE